MDDDTLPTYGPEASGTNSRIDSNLETWEKLTMQSAATVIEMPQQPDAALLEIPGCEFKPTKLELPDGLSFDHWERIGRQLQLADIAVQWWIGDWLNYGEHRYGEKYTQAVQELGRRKQVLMNYASVAKRVEPSRRRDDLDYSIHVEVACLPPAQQQKVLAQAAKEKDTTTVKTVRREVHRVQRQAGQKKSEIELLHTPDVQAYLKRYVETLQDLENDVPVTARFLRTMAQNHAAQANWQKTRTVDDDCRVIQDAVKKNAGQIGEDDLYQYLIDHGYFMSDPEFEERLEYMNRDDVRMALITTAGPEGKQENRRGGLPSIICVPWRKVWDQGSKRERDEDDD